MNLKTIPAMTDSRKAIMNRVDENESPMASDAFSSHGWTGKKFLEPSKTVVLSMAATAAVCKAVPLRLMASAALSNTPISGLHDLDRHMGLVCSMPQLLVDMRVDIMSMPRLLAPRPPGVCVAWAPPS